MAFTRTYALPEWVRPGPHPDLFWQRVRAEVAGEQPPPGAAAAAETPVPVLAAAPETPAPGSAAAAETTAPGAAASEAEQPVQEAVAAQPPAMAQVQWQGTNHRWVHVRYAPAASWQSMWVAVPVNGADVGMGDIKDAVAESMGARSRDISLFADSASDNPHLADPNRIYFTDAVIGHMLPPRGSPPAQMWATLN